MSTAGSSSDAEAVEGPSTAGAAGDALSDAVAALAQELTTIDGLAPRERAELLERVQRVVEDELAALDGL